MSSAARDLVSLEVDSLHPSSRTRSKYAKDRVEEDAPPEEETCCVCLEPFTDGFTCEMPGGCGHKFHCQCLVNHLLTSTRCPLCRRDGAYPEESEYEEPDETPYVSFKDALARGKEAAKTDKKIKRMFDTASRWRKERKDARAKLRDVHGQLNPLEQAIDFKMEAYEKTLQGQFELEHSELIQQRTELEKVIKKSNRDEWSAKKRIAKKFGYANRRFSRRRSRYARDDDNA